MTVSTPITPPARLAKRVDFLACSKGRRFPTAAFVLQVRERGDPGAPRFGFTVTKAMGDAPRRNRMRRRLKEAVRLSAAEHAVLGYDYVLIARPDAYSCPFDALRADLVAALTKSAKPALERGSPSPRPGPAGNAGPAHGPHNG